jgi:hypothetical protein
MSWLLSPEGGVATLDLIGDVTITSIAAGEILKWSGTTWINNTLAEAGIQPSSDFDFTGAADNDLLHRSGGVWVDTAGALTWDGTSLSVDGPVFLQERAAAAADVAGYSQIWAKNTTPSELWFTDDAGTDYRLGPQTSKFWAFDSPSGSSGTFYWGGAYQFHTTSFTPAGGTNVGTANSSYAAHALLVLGAASTDMVVRVTGTSITDDGVRTTSDTEDIDTSGGSANDYYETPKKWLGQVSYSLQSGTGVVIDAGFSKYWDNNNTNFLLTGVEATWLGGANDTAPNIELLHHKSTGWTYSGGGGTPTTPTALADMATDHSTEDNVRNGENGAWKRANLSTTVDGAGSEGILFRVTTTANKTFELGTLQVNMLSTG